MIGPLVLFGLGALFWTAPGVFIDPVPPPTPVPAWASDTGTARRPVLRPELKLAGYTYRCADCHRLFPSSPDTGRPLTWHRDVVLRHGINDRCFNCHHRENRDMLAGDGGTMIPYDQPYLLCGKCHGLVLRDWMHGAHGRTNGYWDARQGPVDRKRCIECHDPHDPPFAPMPPAPGPHTLRMGTPAAGHGPTAEEENPLLIYRSTIGSADGQPSPDRHEVRKGP